MAEFEYNAPNYLDLNIGLDDSDGADTFFDVENSDEIEKGEEKENKGPIKPLGINAGLVSSTTNMGEENIIKSNIHRDDLKECNNALVEQEKPVTNRRRRSILRQISGHCADTTAAAIPLASLTDNLSNELNNLSVKAKKRTHFDGISINVKEEKLHPMTTRRDEVLNSPTLELRNRLVNKEGSVVEKRKKSWDSKLPCKYRYVSMAEEIMHFQKDTPPRFHTSKRLSSCFNDSRLKTRQSYRPRRTIALTPKLMTSRRSRAVEVQSQQEKEEEEIEELKNYQLKAVPLNKKVLQPPKPLLKSGKPATVPEPFNITQVFKKPAAKDDGEIYRFKAKPVPKVILEKTIGVGPKPEIGITVPQSPAITKSTRHIMRVPAVSNDNKQTTESLASLYTPYSKAPTLRKTEVKPFSFETRDKVLMEKKEKKIQEVILAEKKAREFKANPAPTFDPPKESKGYTRYSRLDCSKASISSIPAEETVQPFKARSPRVLRKTPFQPQLEHVHSEPCNIELWTEIRATKRQEFEMQVYASEQKMALQREQIEYERKRKEKEEIAKLRQETVHKAQPMPNFKVPPQHLNNIPLTEPKSPRFTKRSRIDKLCNSVNN